MTMFPRKIVITNKSDLTKFALKIDSSIDYEPASKSTLLRFQFRLTYLGTDYTIGGLNVKGNAEISDSLLIEVDQRTNFTTLIDQVSKKATSELNNITSEIKDILDRGAPHVGVALEELLARIKRVANE